MKRSINHILISSLERLLRTEDELHRADAIYVIAGGNGKREKHAAQLYLQNYAPCIVLSSAITELQGLKIDLARLACWNLKQAQIPGHAIRIMPGQVKSTFDEARLFKTVAQQNGWQSVILVSDPFHSRRARLTFCKALRSVHTQVIFSPCNNSLADRNELSTEIKLFSLFFEVVKLIYYLARGRLGWI